MKTFSTAFQAHLDTGATTLCWCWRLTRRDGWVLGFTDCSKALTFDTTTFDPATGFSPSAIHHGLDMSVDAHEVQGALSSDRITETDLHDGLWDGAAVEVFRVNWADPSERGLIRLGVLGQVRRGRLAFVAEVRSLAHLMNEPVGRTIQYVCDAFVGDARCGVDLQDPGFKGTGTVATVLRDRAFTATGLGAYAAGHFAFGVLIWSTGANAGRETMVLLHGIDGATVTLTLIAAPLLGIAASDTFTVTAGCDKSLDTCRDVFANTVNFRGYPQTPAEDAMLRYAVPGGGNSGDVL